MGGIIRVNPTAMCDRVFVYGTLKQGFRLHGALGDSGLLGRSRVRGYMLHLGAQGFPAVILAEKGPWVHGEIYTVTENVLNHLDMIEGVPRHYMRVPIYATNHGPCWIYVWPKERLETNSFQWDIVPDGIFSGEFTKHAPYVQFLNNNSEYLPPGKPHMVWDQEHGMSVIKQPFFTGGGSEESPPIAIAEAYTSKSREQLPPPPPTIELPEEASQQLPGLEVKFL